MPDKYHEDEAMLAGICFFCCVWLVLGFMVMGCQVYHDEPKLRAIGIELTECREQVRECTGRYPKDRRRRGETRSATEQAYPGMAFLSEKPNE